ncbi:MAG: hypothetical protein JO250_13015 [Armatimonadetes bacterium]|nr:hypothetical protein [Armatimonadota bacterium]
MKEAQAAENDLAAERPASAADAALGTANPVRWAYVIAVALPLIVLMCGWTANSEMKTGVTEITISTLFMGVTFVLFVLTLLNLGVRRLAGPRAAMTQAEMMALYTMLSMGSVVAGVGHFGFFTPFLVNPFYYDTPASGWKAFHYLLPSFIGPRDPAILKGFFEGHSTAFRPEVLAAWAYPLTVWCIFFLVLLWTTLCVAAILRRRWQDEEHLPFPVIALPLEMTREGAPMYRQKLLWGGFAVPLCLHSLNSLHSIYPTLPTLQVNTVHDLIWDAPLQYPWTGMGSLFYQLHPCGVGFGYLINTDVSFSLWFFYFVKKVADVWGVTTGWRDAATGWFVDENGQFPYFSYQGWGAWLVLGLAALWVGRGYFRDYFARALRGDRAGVDRDEPMSARVAVVGFLLGFFALCAFVWSWGGSWWLPIVFLGIYLLLMVTLSRIRAETAVLSSELVWVNPQSIITTVAGTSGLSHADLAHTAMLSWFNTDYRAAGMPHELEGLVGLRRARGRLSPLVPAILLAAAVAMVAALAWDLQLYYVNGASTGNVNTWRITKGSEPWNDLHGWLQNLKPPSGAALGAMGFGVGMTLLLSALRARFVGFPLHPAAYALNMTFANDFFWGDMFIAWLIKATILRYAGLGLYRQGLPFFLGLILGDFVTGSAWSIIGTLFHLNLFRTFAT